MDIIDEIRNFAKNVPSPPGTNKENEKSTGGLQKVKGVVNNLKIIDSTNGSLNIYKGTGYGHLTTTHRTTFRVNNQPCYWGEGLFDISEGDIVTVVGEGYGELYVWAFRNNTINVIYQRETENINVLIYACIIATLLGIGLAFVSSFIFLILPLFFWAPIFGWFLLGYHKPTQKVKIAIQMLSN